MDPGAPSWSLQSRVQLIAFLALITGLAVGSFSMYKAAAVRDDQVIDERVELLASSILKSIEAEGLEMNQASFASEAKSRVGSPETGIHSYQVWTNQGTRLLRSHRAPMSSPLLPVNYTGYRELLINGTAYCAFAAATADRSIVVQVAEPTPERKVQIGVLASEFLAVALLPFVLILGGIRLILKKSFQPVDAVVNNISLRSPVDATPIQVENPPREVLPLVHSLNTHLRRLSHALSIESRFTSVAAHELKTPLAGIRAQAQMANKARNPDELRDSLAGVMQGVDATSRLIDQLIALHQVESTAGTDTWRGRIVDLPAIHRQAITEFQAKADAKGIKLKIVFDIESMHGFEFAIWTLLRNLIGNAIQYTPAEGRVDVRIKRRDFRIILTVDDSGPGIQAETRSRAFEKFDRLGRRGGDGVGLGLSIVANVADLHQAVVELQDSPTGGLRVEVQFHGDGEANETSPEDLPPFTGAMNRWSEDRP
jgi:signal transduction histidine kinase